MNVLDAIAARRSNGKLLGDCPPRAVIERLLAAAATAPNHHLTAPWRFFVLAGEARRPLGEAQAAALRRMLPLPDSPAGLAALAKEQAKPLRTPVVIVAAVEPSAAPRAVELEDVCATAAAIQNLLLGAEGEGLAAIWRTGDTAYADDVRALFPLSARARVLGIIYLGYPDPSRPPPARAPRPINAEWRGWDG